MVEVSVVVLDVRLELKPALHPPIRLLRWPDLGPGTCQWGSGGSQGREPWPPPQGYKPETVSSFGLPGKQQYLALGMLVGRLETCRNLPCSFDLGLCLPLPPPTSHNLLLHFLSPAVSLPASCGLFAPEGSSLPHVAFLRLPPG